MFKNLLDPNSEKALRKALETLDQNIADQRQALVHLIISNQEKLAANELIDQIKELNTLFALFQQADETLKIRIEHLLGKALSAEALETTNQKKKALEITEKALASNQQDTLYTLAKFCEQEDVCIKALEKLSLIKKEALLQEAKGDICKSLIVKQVDSLETLKRLEKELKGKDKKSYRLVQEKIETLEATAEIKQSLIEKSKRIIDSIQKLAKTSYVPLYDSKFLHIETEWKELQTEINNSDFSSEEILENNIAQIFEDAAKQCKKAIDAVIELEKQQQTMEQNQAFLEKSLINLKAFLSSDPIDSNACTQLIQSIKSKLRDLSEISFFDSNTFSKYESAFNFHEGLNEKTNEFEKIDNQVTELQALFSSNHKKKKADQDTLQNIQDLLSELTGIKKQCPNDVLSLDYEIGNLRIINTRIKDLQALEKQSSVMQVEFQNKFDKKLGYVKTEIENKALSTVIRLCKEAQDLLPLCPLKQQEKLQKRLDIHKEEIIKLEDWYNFATLPKRKELCEQMSELAKNAPRSKIKILKEEIKKLQQLWKDLGHARDKEGEALWEQFQEAGNLAYQPIKDLVERKEQEKQKNLETRQQILQKLNKHLDTYFSDGSKQNNEGQKADGQSSEKLLRYSQSNWNQAFPIPSGNNELQKEFDEKITLLNEKLKPIRSVNLGKKNNLLMLAEKLVAVENINDAIEEAKKLQLEWKEVGHCENDDELWKQFRTFCDKIFEARDSLRGEQKDKEQKSISEAKSLCKAIDSIDSEDISEFESEFRKLCSQFEEIKDLPKQRKDLQSQFIKVKKSAKARLESLKRNHESEAFKNVITVCEKLGDIESKIINKQIELEQIEEQFENLCTEHKCPNDSKDFLKNSLLALHQEQNNSSYIQQQTDKLRTLCVELEIELDIDSPSQDKALRMELQVKRLNKKFNQNEKELSISDKILSAFYLGGLNSFQDKNYVNRLIAMQAKAL